MLAFLVLILGVLGANSVPLSQESSKVQGDCGYKGCTPSKPGFLNVHIVPHTHDDVGWLKTVDQYYYGSRNNIQKAGVQYILDSVIKELWEDPKRRFIYVESAFLWKWWVRQSASVQQKVRTLVDEGRLQLVGGAWSMNDEAAAHYQSTIDQFTFGLRMLNKTFGTCSLPRVGWQIDPFGHSREFASLLSMMGYDGLFLGRIDYQDKMMRLSRQNMEIVWQGNDALGKSNDIFTGVLHNTYSPPPGFCFDVLCNDEPIIDDPNSPMYNVEQRIATFVELCQAYAKSYKTNNILITMGEDFNYQDAAMWFTNLDKLIQYTNLKAAKDQLNITLFYSTPNCYLKAIKEANPILSTKSDDFFPYASDSTAYWTGYFTSKPTTKYFEREGNNYLQVVKQLQVLADLEKHNEFVLDELKSAMGVMQHHDAITGTEKDHVAHDYERMLNQAIDDAIIIARQAFNKLSQKDSTEPPLFDFKRCRLNESRCDVSETKDHFIITIYNPLGWSVNEPIRIPVIDAIYDIYAPNGQPIKTQIVDIPQTVLSMPTHKQSKATKEIVFISELKPLGYKSYYVQKRARNKRHSNFEYYTNINDYFDNVKESFEKEIEKDNNLKDILPDYNIGNEDLKHARPQSNDLKVNRPQTSDFKVSRPQTGDFKVGRPQTSDFKVAHPETDFNKNEQNNEKYDQDVINTDKIPIPPSLSESIEYKDANLDLLKDPNNGKQLQELKRFLQSHGKQTNRRRTSKMEYPKLNEDEMRMLSDEPSVEQNAVFENKIFKLHTSAGKIKRITTLNGSDLHLSINMFYYPGSSGRNERPSDRASGAYIFRPNTTQPIPLTEGTYTIKRGDIVTEIRRNLSPAGYLNTRMYEDLNFIENEFIVGPIPIDDDIGKEYIIKYQTDITNNGEFYTDSNGRQMLKRKLNFRPDWNVTLAEPVAGNYYPVTNEIYIENEDVRLSVLTDRSEGGTSLIEGEIELMVHRRLLWDDAFGVGEALNETSMGQGLIVRGKHRVFVTTPRANIRKSVLGLHNPPVVLFAASNLKLNDWMKLNNAISFLGELPAGLHLLTLEPWDDKLLLRFENYLLHSDLEVDLGTIFKNLIIKGLKETMLAANLWVDDYKKWVWNNDARDERNDQIDGFKIKLRAKEIRTFIVEYDIKK